MSSPFPDERAWSRRSCLRWMATAAAWPALTRAACPCEDDGTNEPAQPTAAPPPSDEQTLKTLRVCADPNNFPFSNRAHEGFEDKIVAMLAADLGLPLEYDWLPQRLGFYRTALKTFDSNLVMAAPAGFDKALITNPYYRSTFVFIQRKGAANLIRSFDDPALQRVKVGVTLTGGVNTPPTHALAKRKIIDNVVGFTAFDESQGRPGERIVSAVANGEIDVAVAWGPQVGGFVKAQKTPLEIRPVSPSEDALGDAKMPFTFGICMAVRRSDKPLRKRINDWIVRRRGEIDRILDEYSVPRLPLEAGSGGDNT